MFNVILFITVPIRWMSTRIPHPVSGEWEGFFNRLLEHRFKPKLVRQDSPFSIFCVVHNIYYISVLVWTAMNPSSWCRTPFVRIGEVDGISFCAHPIGLSYVVLPQWKKCIDSLRRMYPHQQMYFHTMCKASSINYTSQF